MAEGSALYAKSDVKYTPAGTDRAHCSICQHYLNRTTCNIVIGRIQPGGWCNKFMREGAPAEAAEGEAPGDSYLDEAEEGEKSSGQMASVPHATAAPTDDVRVDDQDYNPAVEPKSAKAWLNLLDESEKAFKDWNTHCDNIEERFASLRRLADKIRDKEFQIFWANIEVLKPAIYSKPPVPVVVPKFKDRRPVYQAASELLERVCTVAFDLGQINEIMLMSRNDLALCSRGVVWARYEEPRGHGYYESERVCYDHKPRRDFLHSLSRSWAEVSWIAAASYLTRGEARKRFKKFSGDCYRDAEYRVDRDSKELGAADHRERAKFWEIWHRGERRVVWVAKGCDKILDEADPHLDLQNFFPAPKPAYGTVQPNSLVPVPDVLQYEDQLDSLDTLTGRIHALSDCLEVKGFYPAGGAEIADAVQTALATKSSSRVLVPISNWAAFGGSKEVIIWLPIDMIAETVNTLIAVRKQMIEDIYQIMGLSDIMRGSTDPKETLGAQQLKTEYGSSRVRDKQYELVRQARDLVNISADIICEKFDPVTLIEMAQTQLPTQEMQRQQAGQIQQQFAQQMQQAAMQMQAQQPPPGAAPPMPGGPGGPPGQPPGGGQQQAQQLQQMAQQLQQQTEEQINKIMSAPNIEQVLTFLHSNRARAFTLDIETDSTIIADENAEKQRRTEFTGVLGQLLPQLAQMITADPHTAAFCGELLKFAVAPFRAGRSLDGAIDDLVEQMKGKAGQPRGDDPTTAQSKAFVQVETMKNQRQAMKDKADTELKAQELQMRDQQEKDKLASSERIKMFEFNQKQRDQQAKAQSENLKAMDQHEAHQTEILGKQYDMHIAGQKAQVAERTAATREADRQARDSERRANQQLRQTQQPQGLV